MTESGSWSGATSIAVTEDLDDEAVTVYSDGIDGGADSSRPSLRRTGSINDLDFLLDEVSQEEAESRAATVRQQADESNSVSAVASPGLKKCQEWLISSPPPRVSSSVSSAVIIGHGHVASASTSKRCAVVEVEEDENDICIQKLSAMLRDSIRSRNSSSPYSNAEEDESEWLHRRVPSQMSPLSQLGHDLTHNLPAALMSIVTVLTGSVHGQKSNQSKSLTTSFLRILHGAYNMNFKSLNCDVKMDASQENIEKALTDYFVPFKMALKSNTRMNKALSEAVEEYVNNCLEAAKSDIEIHSRYGWVKLSNSDVSDLLTKTNDEKFLNLSPERLAKYAARLQAFIWENMVQRCLKAIKSLTGVDFLKSNNTDGDEYDEPSSLVIESQESETSAPDDSQSQCSQSSLSCVPEEAIIAAVQEHEEAHENVGEDGDSDTQRSDGSIEYIRSSSEYNSQPDSLNLSQNSVPRRSPDIPLEVSPDPGTSQLNGFANETYFNFGGGGSQSSSDGSDNGSHPEPSRKFRRLN